jgi:hypothetical protein
VLELRPCAARQGHTAAARAVDLSRQVALRSLRRRSSPSDRNELVVTRGRSAGLRRSGDGSGTGGLRRDGPHGLERVLRHGDSA